MIERLNDYIGLPYVSRGRSAEGVDCYGLVWLLFRNELGVELPDWRTDPKDLLDVARQLQEVVETEIGVGHGEELTEPEDWAIVLVERSRAAHHMGIYLAGGVIHALENVGVVYQSLSSFLALNRKVRYYRWHHYSSSKIH